LTDSGAAALPARYMLRLFVAGTTANSLRAIENLRRICDAHLAGRVELEIVDIYQQPELAGQHQVVAVPTLVKVLPAPLRRIIGDLSEEQRVLRGLELLPLPPGPDGR
jgi:circadian clock protein KaiB